MNLVDVQYPVGPGLPADNDDLVPPQWFLDRNLASEGLDVYLVKRAKSGPLIVSFGGSGIDPDSGRAQFSMRRFLRHSSYNQIYLRDQFSCWFHNGVMGASTDVASTADYLRELIVEMNPERVVCVGASAGGYAAILFGVLLGADAAIAMNPQTLLQRGVKCQAHGNLHLLKWTDGEGTWEFTKPQFVDLLDLPPAVTQIRILYGLGDEVDVFHAERMRARANVIAAGIEGDHGVAILKARDDGLLTETLKEVLER